MSENKIISWAEVSNNEGRAVVSLEINNATDTSRELALAMLATQREIHEKYAGQMITLIINAANLRTDLKGLKELVGSQEVRPLVAEAKNFDQLILHSIANAPVKYIALILKGLIPGSTVDQLEIKENLTDALRAAASKQPKHAPSSLTDLVN
jgi:hypothetical protein